MSKLRQIIFEKRKCLNSCKGHVRYSSSVINGPMKFSSALRHDQRVRLALHHCTIFSERSLGTTPRATSTIVQQEGITSTGRYTVVPFNLMCPFLNCNHQNNVICVLDPLDHTSAPITATKRSMAFQHHTMSRIPQREWELINPSSHSSGLHFTLMSFNVLAQDLLHQHSYLYNNHQQETLEWKIRWRNIFYEIQKINADILCLQEVQLSHLTSYFSSLNALGYENIYKRRTGPRTDGCAIYYKPSVFRLVEYYYVEYRRRNVEVLDRDNVAVLARFASVHHPHLEIIVANTHLLFNPKREDIRLAQAQLLLTELDRLAYQINEMGEENYLPVIITGDFNSHPQSAVYKFLNEGRIHYEHIAKRCGNIGRVLVPPRLRITDQCQHADLVKKRGEQILISRAEEKHLIKPNNNMKANAMCIDEPKDNEKNLYSSGTLTHKFRLESVYRHHCDTPWLEQPASTHQDKWVLVDYIFYTPKSANNTTLTLTERYKLLTTSQLSNVTIPNGELGSDHFSLAARFHLNNLLPPKCSL